MKQYKVVESMQFYLRTVYLKQGNFSVPKKIRHSTFAFNFSHCQCGFYVDGESTFEHTVYTNDNKSCQEFQLHIS